MGRDLYSCPLEDVTEADIREFVDTAFAARVQAESLILELKGKASDEKVTDAVAAMANTDGGLVIVGVVEKGDNRYPGLTSREIDQVHHDIRSLSSVAFESMPVALANKPDRAVLILRVAARPDLMPVVLNGRVMVRTPGASVKARRDEIVDLVRTGGGERSLGHRPLGHHPMDVGNMSPWGGESDLEVRVGAVFHLSRMVATRDWLGSAAVASIQDVLHESPLPRRIWGEHYRDHELGAVSWAPSDFSHFRVRYDSTSCRAIDRVRPALEALCIVQLSGSILDVALSLRAVPTHTSHTIDLQQLHEVLLALALTAIAVGGAATDRLEDHRPAPPPVMTGWIGGATGSHLLQNGMTWNQIGEESSRREWRLDTRRLADNAIETVDALTRRWLAHLLVGRGILDFETIVEDLRLPGHL